ncbi:haloacid dehalogenase-like hydrolase [Actinomadura sp. SCN-SB]|uniref:haloacid dehalogenase-like hydrolase n=1 Tax=Actinomadura sp. SCN-SB TaxID=3373092 RepID=UPI003750B5D1
MRTLVLWDIDHTLINAGGVGREAYAAVFQQVIGRPLERHAEMAGRTDRAITAETLLLHDIEPTGDLITTFTALLAESFATRRHELAVRGRVLAGAHAALRALADRPDVVQSVLTGNMEPIARYKLLAFGLDGFVDFQVGAYGMDGVERHPLVRLARQRAERKYGQVFDESTTVLIGDTPHDVRAGHEGGARVVAVATGSTPASALRACGAERVIPDLTDTETVLEAILTP